MTGPAHAHGPAHAPFPAPLAHAEAFRNNTAGRPLTAPLTRRSRRSRPLTLTIPPPFKGGIRERRMTGVAQ
jgi:hypothetical protein